MPSTKYVGFNYPTHFLKSRGSVIRNNFLEYRTKQSKKESKDQESAFFLDEFFLYNIRYI